MITMSTKVCKMCGKEKDRSEFDPYKRVCKTCPGGSAAPVVKAAAKKPAKAVPPPVAPAQVGAKLKGVPVRAEKLLAHGSRLLSIALLGPREQDRDFVRALCAGLLEDSISEAGVKSLDDLATA